MIKAIYLDLGKVIIDYDQTIPLESLKKLSDLPLNEIKQILVEKDDTMLRFDRGELSRIDFYKTMSRHLGLDISRDEFEKLWNSLFLPDPLISENLLLNLKRRYRLLMLSNTNEIHFEFIWEQFKIVHHIEDRLLSFELGCLKPDASIYRKAIDRAGVLPGEILFFDDKLENVEAARKAGIQAIRFEAEVHLTLAMSEIGVAIE